MDPFWFYIGLIVLITLAVINCVTAKGRTKLAAFIGNGIIAAVLVCVQLLSAAESAKVEKANDGQTLMSGGLLGSVHYDGNQDGYALLHHSTLMSTEYFAVPEGSCDIPASAKLIGSVYISYKGPFYPDDEHITINRNTYGIAGNIVEVFPDTSDIRFIIHLCMFIAGAVLNIVTFCLASGHIIKKHTE